MKIKIDTNFPEVQKALDRAASQVPWATAVAVNKIGERAIDQVKSDMRRVFDRPTPWVINSIRLRRATKANPVATLQFRDRWNGGDESTMVGPHLFGGDRGYKAMETRLYRAGMLPQAWKVVPGSGARLDAYGNLHRGQISQLLNVLGTYREAGYNKADDRTRARLAAGNAKRNQYGFTYWVNPAEGSGRRRHLLPGVYQRFTTGFGTSLKPVLIFVPQVRYRIALQWEETVRRIKAQHFRADFAQAFDDAMRTAIPRQQGGLF